VKDLEELFSDWLLLVKQFENNESISKQEVLRLLDSDRPVHESAKPLLAGLISGEYKLPKGPPATCDSVQLGAVLRYRVLLNVAIGTTDTSHWPADVQKEVRSTREALLAEANLLNGPPVKQQIKEQVAGYYSISVRTLETWIKAAQR